MYMTEPRTPPNVTLTPCEPSYARFLSEGMDSLQEAFNLKPTVELVALLDRSRAAAEALSGDKEGSVTLQLGPETFQIFATGAKGGFRWRLANDDMLLMIGSPSREWTISCRYTSGGLWEHGTDALRARAFAALRPYTQQIGSDVVRVSRCDWCFDFYSPALTREMIPRIGEQVVTHSGVKTGEVLSLMGAGGLAQTLTIGSKSGLQVQLYDKSREIDEASGKTWFWDIWIAGLDGEYPWEDRPRDVWRLEIRWSADFLKDRNIRRPDELRAALPQLITESLSMRRLTVPTGDSNRRRWPMHPIWSAAFTMHLTREILPLGRKVTGRRGVLVDRGVAQVAGALRSLAELEGGYDPKRVVSLAERAKARIEADPDHQKKLEIARARYSEVDEAR